jgi:DNA-binding NarL/FixJ family response regulator
LLSFDFDVVAAATNGDEALEAAERFDPDIVALDITMPGRNGFQTAQELRRRGSRARIVFVSMHESDEFVAEAFRSGGSGYVLKTRLHVDLVGALERVGAGQLFVPSVRSLFAIDKNVSGHLVQFHTDDRVYVDEVSALLNVSLRRGDAVALVCVGSTRAQLATRLRAFGWNVGESGEQGRYRASDSASAAASVVRHGHADADGIGEYVAELDVWRANIAGPQARLTLVGDIATQILLNGHVDAATELEGAWNELTRALPFLTVCCYPMATLLDDGRAGLHPRLCAEHFAVAHTPEGGLQPQI